MNSVEFGLLAFGYVALIVGICGICGANQFDDHEQNMDDEGGWK